MPGVSSVQITFHEDRDAARHAMPPGGFRLAVVNAWNLQSGLAGATCCGRISSPGGYALPWFGVQGGRASVGDMIG